MQSYRSRNKGDRPEGRTTPESNESEKVLVVVGKQPSMNSQCDAVAIRAKVILGCIIRRIVSRSKGLILPPYMTLVRLILGHCLQF